MQKEQAPIGFTLEKNYDSEFCGSIPLHLVNLIQRHGFLLTLDKQNLKIRQVSENASEFLNLPIEDIQGRPIASFLPNEQAEDLKSKIEGKNSQEKIPFTLTFQVQGQEVAFTALVHPTEEYVLIEIEKAKLPTETGTFIQLYQQTKYITSLLKQANSIEEIAQITVEEMKKLTGFDRILAYQFDPQWNGMVIGQAKEEDMEDYMGLRFPASDVPKQTRDLYLRNPYRLIPTREYKPARLIPVINPITQRFTDLSECNLRSVAGVHLEYMANMGIMASMSLPLIIDDKLWGLISCHHRSAIHPSYELRSALELLSDIVSTQLAAKEREKSIELRAQLRGIHAQLLEQLYTTSNFPDGLLNGNTKISELLNLSGVAVLYEGGVWTEGQVPSNQEIKELVFWLKRNQNTAVYATDTLPKQYVRAKEYHEVASGLIMMSINPEQAEYVLGFRPEVLQTIHWGGNPDQAIQMEADGKSYHPRNSFTRYQNTVRHTSLPWLPEELEAAEALRSAVLEKIIRERY
ncbi:GAF domain-containing protein [Rufibacter roseus]|uniref:GAF domain-containing protein n=1 Tax=Rufibacter roseus TaxID=1567108 RepID=A0ABW2DMB0_9BACT|nr:GAF domain-containing protein [Rufibacter roseus]